MRPTLRCVLVFAAGFPVSLLAVLVSTRLWTLWLAYLGFAALLMGIDALLGLPRRRLSITTTVPDTLYIGESDPLELELHVRHRRRTAPLTCSAISAPTSPRNPPRPYRWPVASPAGRESP